MKNGLSQMDLDIIAAMHIKASISAPGMRTPGWQFRFFRDKVSLFHEFDPESILIEKNEAGEICGILIFTSDERKFNQFAGPRHLRFYARALKTVLGFYGFNFKKFLSAGRSMMGLARKTVSEPTGDFGKIWVLLVMEECRGKGIAAKLIKSCIELMKNKNLKYLIVTVKTDNIPAIKAYGKCGFVNVGTCEESSGHSYVMKIELQ